MNPSYTKDCDVEEDEHTPNTKQQHNTKSVMHLLTYNNATPENTQTSIFSGIYSQIVRNEDSVGELIAIQKKYILEA